MDLDKYFVKSELIPAIIQEKSTGEVLMLAYMNRESMQKTFETGYTWFWSRSRQELWNKGATSGHLQKVIDIPRLAGVVHMLHHLERERRGRGVGVRLAGHVLDALIQSRVAEGNGRVAAVEELVDRLALFQAGQRAVLPQDGRGVRERGRGFLPFRIQ